MPPAGYQSPDELLERMRTGDREAAAAFMERFGPLIRRRVRGKLGPAMRRLFDSQEILSTLGRRLVVFVGAGSMRATTMDQLMNLVFRIADNSLIEKARVFRSLEAKEGEDSPLAQQVLRRLQESERRGPEEPLIEIDKALCALEDPLDREILSLWLGGMDLERIAEQLDMKPATARKRWQRIREELKALCEAGVC